MGEEMKGGVAMILGRGGEEGGGAADLFRATCEESLGEGHNVELEDPSRRCSKSPRTSISSAFKTPEAAPSLFTRRRTSH